MKLIIVLIVCLANVALRGEESRVLANPSEKEILNRLRHGHPRLIALENDFVQLRKRIASDEATSDQATSDQTLKKWHKILEAEGRQILSDPPSQYEIPESKILLATSRRVLRRTETLALLYRLDGDRRYADRAWAELKAAAGFKDWNPQSFLDTAEMTRAFAIGYDWLYDVWTKEQRKSLHTAIVEKGLKPALGCYRGTAKYRAFQKLRNNWNEVCNGGIGLGALAVADDEPELAGEILSEAVKSIRLGMAEYAPAGAWPEGPSYWNYATDYNVAFIAALETALGTDFGLSEAVGFAETGLFPIYMTGPLGRTMNFADASDGRLHAPQMFWLARKFNRPEYAKFEIATTEPKALDLVWYEARGPSNDPRLPLGKLFEGIEVATLRSAWDDHDALFVGLKAGDNKATHGHLDLGSFMLDALGKRWAVDLGGDDYTLRGYFGRERWTYYRLRAEGHNTLLIDPAAGPDQDPEAHAKIVRFKCAPDRALAITDLTQACGGGSSKVRRGVMLSGHDRAIVEDEIDSGSAHDVWWFMHTPAEIEIDKQGTTAILTQGKIRLLVRILSPAKAAFSVMEAVPLPASPHPGKQAKNGDIRKLTIHLENVHDLRLAVLFVPLRIGAAAETDSPIVVPLDAW
ncbi:MAG: hypothetical protein QOG91_402 [Candidatus Parcubacteria bacterium]|jgi:hypothetical protein|nr:hypothetical protein [Candidatus Parcubacteria bacterium]